MATTMRIKKGDLVQVLAGKDRGKQGRVLDARPRDRSVIVENINIAKRHTKPRQRSSGGPGQLPQVDKGGIIDVPAPMPIAKVMLVCTHCDRPTRIAHTTLDNGKRVRVCRHCGEQLEGASS